MDVYSRSSRRLSPVVASAVIAASAGTTLGVVNTSIVFQVSLDAVNWTTSVEAFSGQPTANVYVRALVSYTGTQSPIGLGSLVFQPTISNARPSDSVLPFINGGVGGNSTTPMGVISGAQLTDTTSFGRVSPWGRSALSSPSGLRGFFHTTPTGDGLNYLRLA